MATGVAGMSDAQRPGRSVGWRAITLALLSVCMFAAGSAAAATLSPAEKTFKTAYVKLVPSLNRASSAVVHAVDGSAKDTDANVVTIFGGVAREWASATNPLIALYAPAPEAKIFAAVLSDARAVETDLVAIVKSGRTHSVKLAKAAGTLLALNFNALAAEVKQMKTKLGLP